MSSLACVYLLASQKNGTIYTGVTSDLEKRILQHKTKTLKGFTEKYDVNKLVWYKIGEDITSAIELEKKIKNRGRNWKINLIEKTNPGWRDLSVDFLDPATYAQDDDKGNLVKDDETLRRSAMNKGLFQNQGACHGHSARIYSSQSSNYPRCHSAPIYRSQNLENNGGKNA